MRKADSFWLQDLEFVWIRWLSLPPQDLARERANTVFQSTWNSGINAESARFTFIMTKEPVAPLRTTLASSEPGVFLVSYSLELAPLVLLLD